jgi:hypothetical protein
VTVLVGTLKLQLVMHIVEISEIAKLLNGLADATEYATKRCEAGNRDIPVPQTGLADLVAPVISITREHAKRMQLQFTLDRVADKDGSFPRALLQPITFLELLHQLRSLRDAIESDFKRRHFIFIAPDKAEKFKELSPKWRTVWKRIPSCEKDSKEAVYSFCLDRFTASVFHSMRVSEHGLRNVAKKVGVRLTDKNKPQPIEDATWTKVLDGIRAEIATARVMAQGPRKNKKLQFYSEAAETCSYFRDIWRNNVSHTRSNYTEAEALRVLNRVQEFMHLLAGAPK